MPHMHSDGADIAYEQRGSGSPVVLVSGTGYSGSTWHPAFLESLAEHHTVITFDHRGTGSSTATDEDYTTAMFARDANAVIRAVGLGPAHVIGHSMGGRVAQEMYFLDRDLVRSLVLAASGAGTTPVLPLKRVGIPIGTVRGLLTHGLEKFIAVKHRTNFFTSAFVESHPDEVRWLDDAWASTAPTIDDYLKHVRARQAFSTVVRLPSVSVPTLVVVGSADTADGGTGSHVASSEDLARLIPGARLAIIEGAKHGFMWENREDTVPLFLDFLAEVDGAFARAPEVV